MPRRNPQLLVQPGAAANEYGSKDSEMGEYDEPCYRYIFTLPGAWAFFGLCYWIVITLWGFEYAQNDQNLIYYTVSALSAAAISIAILFAGITRGVEAGTERARKWVFPYVTVCCVNIFVHTGFAQSKDIYLPYSIAFIVCDFLSMLYVSGVFYGFSIETNKWFRKQSFALEWFDLLSQIAVAIIYANLSQASSVETKRYENAFWSFILIQLAVWVLPIIFGAGLRKHRCLRHIFILDAVTDFPLLIINIASGAFELQFWILIDLVVKILFMIRGVYYFFSYHKHLDIDEVTDICVICSCCDDDEDDC